MMNSCQLCEDCPFVQQTKEVFHEIHVTVETDNEQAFYALCAENNIKAVTIVDFRSEHDRMKHIMTSQRLKGTDEDALIELERIKSVFANLNILREKIETNLNADRDYSEGYFESHLDFEVEDVDQFKSILPQIGGIRLSQNTRKIGNKLLATVRDYKTTPELFIKKMEKIRDKFEDFGYKTEKLIIEYCYLDTYEDQDSGWKIY